MSFNKTIMLVGSALALLAFIVLVEQPLREARQQQTSRKLFPGLAPDQITSVQIRPAAQLEILAERKGESWQLSKPLAYPASGELVEALLREFASLEWQAQISAQELAGRPDAQQEFGLATPQFSIALAQGKETWRVLIGATSALGDQVFVQLVGGNSIYLAGSELLKLLPRTKDDWRDTTFLDPACLSYDGVKVRATSKAFELKRDSDQLWRMRAPVEARANSPKVEELLADLQKARVAGFVVEDPDADLEAMGLDISQTPELELSFLQGTNTLVTLQVGSSPTNNPALVYARRLDKGNVVLVPKEPFRSWSLPYTNLLDRHLVSTPVQSIRAIEIEGEEKFKLQKQADDSWVVSAKNSFSADPELVSDLLNILTTVDVEIEKTVVSDFATYGLAPAQLRYVVQSEPPASGTNAIAALDFGTITPEGNIFQRRADETSVNRLACTYFDRLPRASWQLRDRQIFDFAASNVVSITIEHQGSRRKLIRDFQGDWTFAPGSIGTINPFSLEEGLHRLGHLKAVYWTSCGETNLERFGFNETNHQVTFEVKRDNGSQNYAVRFGKASPYVHPYAAIVRDGQTLVFEFPAPLFLEFVRRDLTIPPAYRTRPR